MDDNNSKPGGILATRPNGHTRAPFATTKYGADRSNNSYAQAQQMQENQENEDSGSLFGTSAGSGGGIGGRSAIPIPIPAASKPVPVPAPESPSYQTRNLRARAQVSGREKEMKFREPRNTNGASLETSVFSPGRNAAASWSNSTRAGVPPPSPSRSRIPTASNERLGVGKPQPWIREAMAIAEAEMAAEDAAKADRGTDGSGRRGPSDASQLQLSPSPAPRPRRRPETGAKGHQKTTSQPANLGSQRRPATTQPRTLVREDTASSVESLGAHSLISNATGSDIDRKLEEFQREQALAGASIDRKSSSLFSRVKVSPKIVQAGKELIRRTSNNSLNGGSPSSSLRASSSKAKQPGNWLSRTLSTRKSSQSSVGPGLSPRPSNESIAEAGADFTPPGDGKRNGHASLGRSATVPPNYNGRSPNKSFNWAADADFTAGDLQFSNSPPVNIGRTNTKLDEIAAREKEVFRLYPPNAEERPKNTKLDEIAAREKEIFKTSPVRRDNRPLNTRLDEIAAREREVAEQYPDEALDPATMEEIEQLKAANARAFQSNQQASRGPMRSEELLRDREIASLSRRGLATARLDEIGGRDGDLRSWSPSPQVSKEPSRESMRDTSLPASREEAAKMASLSLADLSEGERIPGTPSTRFKITGKVEAKAKEDDPLDLLRRLSRATSSSPATERPATPVQSAGDELDPLGRKAHSSNAVQQSDEPKNSSGDAPDSKTGQEPRVGPDSKSGLDRRDISETKQKKAEGTEGVSRPTVGFAGLRRDPSVDSLASKRSTTHSETDPTERIAGELKLFAPADIHSERNSIRAPSPDWDDEEDDEKKEGGDTEETPKATRIDPLSLPTPQIVGAYVDTPATVKVDKATGSLLGDIIQAANLNQVDATKSASQTRNLGLKAIPFLRGGKQTHSPRKSKHPLSAKGDRITSRSQSGLAPRRARSMPRARSPLINSARPPTVKDDLHEIQLAHHVEDSTLDLDDFSEVALALETKVKVGDETSSNDPEMELERIDRMNKTLKTSILGIRTAKEGIERLEDRVSHADIKPAPAQQNATSAVAAEMPHMKDTRGYIQLPVPRLWFREPHFRFTLTGLMVLLLGLWYTAETSMCAAYCKPQYCYPGKPCDWSPDDPNWGFALPVKLDQWATGGQGRQLAKKYAPEVADWIADLWDVANGIDIAKVDTTYYDWAQRQQHRRRMVKKGLLKPLQPDPQYKDMFDSWKAARIARERADSAREMGLPVDEEETMDGDEKVRR